MVFISIGQLYQENIFILFTHKYKNNFTSIYYYKLLYVKSTLKGFGYWSRIRSPIMINYLIKSFNNQFFLAYIGCKEEKKGAEKFTQDLHLNMFVELIEK